MLSLLGIIQALALELLWERGVRGLSDENRWAGYTPAIVIVLLLLAAAGGLAFVGVESVLVPITLAGLNLGLAIQLLVLRHHWRQSLSGEDAET
jgi:hypothetical protein